MVSRPNLGYALRLSPRQAVEYFEGKGLRLTESWTDLWEEAHAKASTVAHVTRMDVLNDINEAVGTAIREGRTERWFQEHLTPRLQAKGWWGKAIDKETGEVLDAYPGTSRPVQYGSPHRLKTIYRTNTQTAYMAGRYRHLTETSDQAPYWRYTAVLDQRTRPGHAALHGKVFRHDDPIWDAIYPPNGFNCRCRVDAFSERALERRGLKVETSDGHLTQETIETDGAERTITIWRGEDRFGRQAAFRTDPGWNYNPGKSWVESLKTKLNASNHHGIAAQAVAAIVGGASFRQWWDNPSGDFPLVVIPDAHARRIGAQNHTGLLSPDTLGKQLANHPELTPSEYALAQRAVDNGRFLQDSNRSGAYLWEVGGYVLVVKATVSGQSVYVQSYRRLSSQDAKRDAEIRRIERRARGHRNDEK